MTYEETIDQVKPQYCADVGKSHLDPEGFVTWLKDRPKHKFHNVFFCLSKQDEQAVIDEIYTSQAELIFKVTS